MFNKINNKILHIVLVTSLLSFMTACGSAPNIRDAVLIKKIKHPVHDLVFVYRDVKLTKNQLISRGNVSIANVGFYQFGQVLVDNAAEVFLNYDINLIDAQRVVDKQPVKIKQVNSSSGRLYTLTVFPLEGRVMANRHATRVSYVFNAVLFSIADRQVIWSAKIDTSTWKGQDFIQKNLPATVYDKEYAMQLLSELAREMVKAGLIMKSELK